MSTFLILLITLFNNPLSKSDKIAQTEIETIYGKLRGIQSTTKEGTGYISYLGVPYAQPPVDRLRFELPQPPKKWEGVLKADSDHLICHQFLNISRPEYLKESEDCLYLNIHVPQNNSQKLAVMFYIYGGGYNYGFNSKDFYGPEYFMNEGVIIVVPNFRLGCFGFLSNQDATLPGNLGLKDILQALKWVKENIERFNGDNNRITIFGESTGGSSVGYLVLGKSAQGLFQGAISQSGSPLTTLYQKSPKTNAAKLLKALNSTLENFPEPESLKNFLKDIPEIKMKEACFSLYDPKVFDLIFMASIEPDHEGAVITGHMYEDLKSGKANKVPYIIGYTSEECISELKNSSFKEEAEQYDRNSSKLIPVSLKTTSPATVAELIRGIYLEGNESFAENLGAATKFCSEDKVVRSVIKTAKLQSKHSDVYLYQFSYSAENNSFPYPGLGKVDHAEDLYYLWNFKELENATVTDEEDLVQKRFTKLWSNFAKTLEPGISGAKWEKVKDNEKHPAYLDIDLEMVMKQNAREGRIGQWEDIFDKYGIHPFDAY